MGIEKLFEDSGSGAENLLIDKILIIIDSGSGVEVLLVDKILLPFEDSGSGIEVYYHIYHFPVNLKRIIILIRDRK